jgi:signal peptidase I
VLTEPAKDYYRENYVQAFTIPSAAMMDTLLVGDYIIVDNSVYRAEAPRRGDIVVFTYPLDDRRTVIHRIIGMPGDVVHIHGQKVLINGKVLEEPYVRRDGSSQSAEDSTLPALCSYAYGCDPLVVPADSYFVMGDNRNNARDSRYWGFVKRERIKGKPREVYWSWDSDQHWLRAWRLGRTIL